MIVRFQNAVILQAIHAHLRSLTTVKCLGNSVQEIDVELSREIE